jgi:toxin ParE1/3/4
MACAWGGVAPIDEARAAQIYDALVPTCNRVHPSGAEMGRRGRGMETRELVIPRTPFIVPYGIHVLRIFHAARQWPETF